MSELITFPPATLGPDPVRLPVLARGEGWFAIDKPAGLLLAPDALHEENTPSIAGAIHAAAVAGKPQLAALGIGGCSRIHTLDAEIAGAAVLAATEEKAAALRNQLGSGHWLFVFDIVVEGDAGGTETQTCDLPLVRHNERPRMVVSHREGKRCRTEFIRVARCGGYELWQARTAENRLHQVRVHAAESGLRIVGESVYARVRPVFLSDLKPRYRPGRDEERPLHPGLAMHLSRIVVADGRGAAVTVDSPRPKSLTTLLRRLTERA